MHSIDLTPLYQVMNTAVLTLLGGLMTFAVGWASWALHRYAAPFVGAQLETKAACDLNTALANGVAIAIQKVEAIEKLHADVAVKSGIAASAAQYAIDHAPEAVARFGLDPDELALKALAYLPPPPLSDLGTTGARMSTLPVTMQALGRI
jgi:hypothetical protein